MSDEREAGEGAGGRPGVRPGRAPAPGHVVTYIVRRLIAAVFLLIVVSMITFAIFFLVPRLAGRPPTSSPRGTSGATRPGRRSTQVEQQLGFDDPLYVQYGRFLKGIVARRGLRHGHDRSTTARRRASATRSSPAAGAGRTCSTGCP